MRKWEEGKLKKREIMVECLLIKNKGWVRLGKKKKEKY